MFCLYWHVKVSNEEGRCSPAFMLRKNWREAHVLCVLDIFPLASNRISTVQRKHRWCEITRSRKCRLRTLLLTDVSLKAFFLASIAVLLPFWFRKRHVGSICTTTVWRTVLSPSSGRWQSNQWWQTTCGPWYRWLHSWGCRSAWSGPPAANFSTDPSSLSWSGRESEPANSKSSVSVCSQGPAFYTPCHVFL